MAAAETVTEVSLYCSGGFLEAQKAQDVLDKDCALNISVKEKACEMSYKILSLCIILIFFVLICSKIHSTFVQTGFLIINHFMSAISKAHT